MSFGCFVIPINIFPIMYNFVDKSDRIFTNTNSLKSISNFKRTTNQHELLFFRFCFLSESFYFLLLFHSIRCVIVTYRSCLLELHFCHAYNSVLTTDLKYKFRDLKGGKLILPLFGDRLNGNSSDYFDLLFVLQEVCFN